MYFLHRRLFLIIVTFVIPTIFCVSTLSSQERKGQITGRVTDSTHAVLQGARVEVQPTGQVVVSGTQGEFTISGLAPGHYTLAISYVGFAPFSTEVTVSGGGTANVDATLQVEAKGEQITVNGGREYGEVEALNRQRTSDNILQVLPSEVITSLPNTNVADAVGRLPSVSLERDEGEGKYVQIRGTEPRLSNVTVDGVHLASPEGVRNVKLDALPADLVDSVEISKTLSANQEADAIGGSVNLVTKRAHDDPYVSVLALGGYTPIQSGRWLDQYTATAGQRFGEKKQFGILVGGSFDWNERAIYDIEPGQGFNSLTDPTKFFSGPNTVDYRDYWYNRSRYGFGGTLDYKLGEFSSVYLRGLFSRFNDSGQDWIYSPAVGSFDTANGPVAISNADGTSAFTHVWRTPQQRLFSIAAGARHDIGTNIITYDLSLGQGRQVGSFPRAAFVPNPNDSGAPLNNIQFAVDATHPFTPKFNVLNGVNIFDPTGYLLDAYQTADNHNYERDVTGSFSIIHQYNIGSHYGSFEVGSKVRDSRKSQLDNQHFFAVDHDVADANNVDSALSLSSVLGTFRNPGYYFGTYPFGPTSDWNKILALVAANPGGTISEDTNKDLVRSIPNDYVINERVSAGYVMNTINFGAIRLQTGVRIEATDDSLLGNNVILNKGKYVTTAPVVGDHDYIDVLPSVQLQYAFGDNKIRAAYGMGIARPNFGDLPPFITQDDARNKVSVGNPALRPTHAHNYDLLFERYLKPAGVIQVGGFYKDLWDPIFENVQSPVISGTFAGFTQSQAVNGSRAHIAGLEMTWQQHLSFLPNPFDGLGVRTNYSYTTSETGPPAGFGRTDHPALQRQAPNNWNLDLTYDKKGFAGRIGATHNDANIFAYNYSPAPDGSSGPLHGPNGDVYLYPHTQLDAQASYWIPNGHGLQAVVSLLNLTNEVFGFYQGSERFPIQREFYDRTVMVGLRWTLSRESK